MSSAATNKARKASDPAPFDLAALQPERRDPRQLKPHPRNSRFHPDVQLKQLAASLRRFGITKPILIDEHDTILAGHATTLAAIECELGAVPVVVARGWSDEQKRAYLIADNRLGEKSTWDSKLLAVEIGDLKPIGDDLAAMGFTDKDVTAALKRAAPDKHGSEEQLGDVLVYRVIVDCRDEAHQTEMIERFDAEGLKCRALIS
jgi:ParB-like chromosome segregation protein Spo0J